MVFGHDDHVKVLWDDLSQRQILDECARLAPGAKWEDKRFAANDPRSMYTSGRPHSGTPYGGGGPIQWLRPEQWKGADAASVALVRGGAEAGDVVQGELGDCYLLGAMSSIASKNLLPKLVVTSAADTQECIRRGFVTFQLYKFGEWQEVTVDTSVPCNAEGEPIFAHSRDINEIWVPMLEKAYAKLHGSYEALDGGSVTAALVDLTGGVGESIDMTDEDTVYEIADGSFWKRLRRYASKDAAKPTTEAEAALYSGQYLLGAALSQSQVPDMGGHEAMQVTDLGILVNHAYTLVQVAEVGSPHGERQRLLQLRNPWGMKEWEGPWSDGAREWETAIGMKAKEKLNVEFKDDGTFWMAWEDFQAHFNKIYVCRIFNTVSPYTLAPGQRLPTGVWCRYEIEGAWDDTNSGGCFNFPEWRRNPQYELRTGEQCDAVFLLMQRDPRTADPTKGALDNQGHRAKLGGDEGGPTYDKKIGMYVMRGHDIYRRKVLFDSEEVEGDEVLDSTPYMAYRDVQCNTMDEEDDRPLSPYERYVLLPTTFQPGMKGSFRIIALTSAVLEQPPTLLPRLNELHVSGAWTEQNAGGCRNYYTWRRNEQYHLKLSRAARVSVVLMRHNAEAINSDLALHSKKSKAKLASKKKRAKDATNFLIGFVVAKAEPRAERKRLHVEGDEIVDKTQYTAAFEVAAEFYSEEQLERAPDRSYIVVPSTFEPGIDDPSKHGDFELMVYTDDDRARLTRIEPSTWHVQELAGEWSAQYGSAGGCRNYPSWVQNPLYALRASRAAKCELFLRQPTRDAEHAHGGGEGAHLSVPSYPGIGFYVTVDDGSLSLDDVRCESGFRQQVETRAAFELQGDTPYLLIPMTYQRGISMPYTLEVYCNQPSCRVELLPVSVADARRAEVLEHEAARTITRAFIVSRVWRLLRQRPPDRERAKQYIVTWFRKPVRDNDEGYLDINLALNALESAYIQLTGKSNAKGKFFPQMRERLSQRGHKIADYDVCL